MRTLSLHVMVVADDAAGLAAVEMLLCEAGCRVTTAHDGREALAQLRSDGEPPDVLLTDLVMPHVDGWTLVRRLRADPMLMSLPIVVMTASGRRAMDAVRTAAAHLPKPLIADDLLDALEHAAATARRRPRWKSGARARASVVDAIDCHAAAPAQASRASRRR